MSYSTLDDARKFIETLIRIVKGELQPIGEMEEAFDELISVFEREGNYTSIIESRLTTLREIMGKYIAIEFTIEDGCSI